jgi:hypothetical protein
MGKEQREKDVYGNKIPENPKVIKNLFEAENYRKRLENQIVRKVS